MWLPAWPGPRLRRVLSRRDEYKTTIDFTGGRRNESMLAYLFRVLPTSFQPPGRSPKEVARPASHALPTPSWESTQRKIIITPIFNVLRVEYG